MEGSERGREGESVGERGGWEGWSKGKKGGKNERFVRG